jgi:uncharacterized protein (DUF169 family)
MNKTFFPCKFITIRFADKLSVKEAAILKKSGSELYCTAIAKAAKSDKIIIIDTQKHKCTGGNYFVGRQNAGPKEIADAYINKECVFSSRNHLKAFLAKTGRNPIKARYVIFEPRMNPAKIPKKTEIILMVVTPDIAGRIIGLAAYNGHLSPDIIPAASTCTALFRPLIKPESIHVNFIDYFDREYQCKGLYSKTKLIISTTPELYAELVKIYPKSCHGGKKPGRMDLH